jgi:uncharacterized protein (DUF362 family)
MVLDHPSNRLGRRHFLAQLAGGALGVGACLLSRCRAAAQGLPDVVVARGGEVNARLAAVLRPLGGLERFVRPGCSVVIKPNAAFGEAPERGSGTTPEVVAAVVHACKAARAGTVIVAEHCLSNRGMFGTSCDPSGITQAAIAEGAETIDTGMSPGNYSDLRLDAPDRPTRPISGFIQRADVAINLARLKTHPCAGYTMTIKNLMGVMLRPDEFHNDGWAKLPERLSCLGRAVQPFITLSIIDATDRVENWAAGDPNAKLTRLDTLIAGINMVSVDAIGMTLFGVDPLADWSCATGGNYLRIAQQAGWGKADLRQISLVNVSL